MAMVGETMMMLPSKKDPNKGSSADGAGLLINYVLLLLLLPF